MKKIYVALMFAAFVTPALATSRTVTLIVPDMSCAACPITVKKALSQVRGVSKIDTHIEQREAVITYDDSKTNPQQLVNTTKDAGYVATVKQ